MQIDLVFGDSVPEFIRHRLTYAARTFAAVYGITWASGSAAVRLCYGVAPSRSGDVPLSVVYRPVAERASPPRPIPHAGLFLDGESDVYPAFHAGPLGVDWLGEIFEWIGNETEVRATSTDALGRVPFSESIPGLYGLDPEVPWAAIAMRGLNEEIRAAVPGWLDRPVHDGPPLIIASHDIDFLPVSRIDSAERGAKNVLIALLLYRNPKLAVSLLPNIGAIDDFADVARRERRAGIESSSYLIVEKKHRRDANYALEDPKVIETFRTVAAEGMEIGVHGSYTSVLGGGSLSGEYARIRAAGFEAAGGRQHWLRFRGAELFDALIAASAQYDSSMGYSDRPGFRSGASFAYAPYDFRCEAPFNLIELPLVIMDGTLFSSHGYDVEGAQARCERVLRRATLYSTGGVSILWHNTTFGKAGAQLPRAYGDLYWRLKREDVAWVSGRTALRHFLPRFAASGLPAPAGRLQAVSNVT